MRAPLVPPAGLHALAVTVSTALAAATVGCAGGVDDQTMDVVFDPCEPVAVVLDPGLAADEAAVVERAAALWAAVAPIEIAAVEAGPGIGLRFESAAPAFRGIYLDETGDIVLNREVADPAARATTLAHELGHAFGLWHRTDGDASVMVAGNVETPPTAADAAALVALWGDCAARQAD